MSDPGKPPDPAEIKRRFLRGTVGLVAFALVLLLPVLWIDDKFTYVVVWLTALAVCVTAIQAFKSSFTGGLSRSTARGLAFLVIFVGLAVDAMIFRLSR